MRRKGHTANIESGRIETKPDVDHVFSNLPNSIIPLIKGVEGVPESHTISSAQDRVGGHRDVQDEDCGEHEDHELPEHRSERPAISSTRYQCHDLHDQHVAS